MASQTNQPVMVQSRWVVPGPDGRCVFDVFFVQTFKCFLDAFAEICRYDKYWIPKMKSILSSFSNTSLNYCKNIFYQIESLYFLYYCNLVCKTRFMQSRIKKRLFWKHLIIFLRFHWEATLYMCVYIVILKHNFSWAY